MSPASPTTARQDSYTPTWDEGYVFPVSQLLAGVQIQVFDEDVGADDTLPAGRIAHMSDARWIDLGPVEDLKHRPLTTLTVGRTKIALSYADGRFGAISAVCNHVGGPLGEGRLDGDYVVCPWHSWRFHRVGGQGEPGYEEDAVPRHELREEGACI
jgi:nitrite reductase/ring-hydroxylating ferredoxin subunit